MTPGCIVLAGASFTPNKFCYFSMCPCAFHMHVLTGSSFVTGYRKCYCELRLIYLLLSVTSGVQTEILLDCRHCSKKVLDQRGAALLSSWRRAEEAFLAQAHCTLQHSAEEQQAQAVAAADRSACLSVMDAWPCHT